MGPGEGRHCLQQCSRRGVTPDPAHNTSTVLLLGGPAGKLVGSIGMGQGKVIEGEQSKDMMYIFENVIRKPIIIHK